MFKSFSGGPHKMDPDARRAPNGQFAKKGILERDASKLKFGKLAGGSNGARFADHEDGSKHLVKTYGMGQAQPDRIASELLSNAIYREMDARVPEAGRIKLHDGRSALSYPLLEGKPKPFVFQGSSGRPSRAVGEHFVTDALLANWDVAGLEDDNILWDPEGRPFRVDQGGTLEFRAQGQRKEFGPVPKELHSMMTTGGQGRRSSLVTEEGIRRQAREVGKRLTPGRIDELVDAAGFKDKEMRERVRLNLKARVAWLAAAAGPKQHLQEDAPFWLLQEALKSTFAWDNIKHPRDQHGKFVKTLASLSPGDSVSLDSKTVVKRDKDLTFRVVRSGQLTKGFKNHTDAARLAVDKSVKSKDADSIGGAMSSKDYDDYLSKLGFDPVDPKTFGPSQNVEYHTLEGIVANLKVRLADQELRGKTDKYVERGVPLIKKRLVNAELKLKKAKKQAAQQAAATAAVAAQKKPEPVPEPKPAVQVLPQPKSQSVIKDAHAQGLMEDILAMPNKTSKTFAAPGLGPNAEVKVTKWDNTIYTEPIDGTPGKGNQYFGAQSIGNMLVYGHGYKGQNGVDLGGGAPYDPLTADSADLKAAGVKTVMAIELESIAGSDYMSKAYNVEKGVVTVSAVKGAKKVEVNFPSGKSYKYADLEKAEAHILKEKPVAPPAPQETKAVNHVMTSVNVVDAFSGKKQGDVIVFKTPHGDLKVTKGAKYDYRIDYPDGTKYDSEEAATVAQAIKNGVEGHGMSAYDTGFQSMKTWIHNNIGAAPQTLKGTQDDVTIKKFSNGPYVLSNDATGTEFEVSYLDDATEMAMKWTGAADAFEKPGKSNPVAAVSPEDEDAVGDEKLGKIAVIQKINANAQLNKSTYFTAKDGKVVAVDANAGKFVVGKGTEQHTYDAVIQAGQAAHALIAGEKPKPPQPSGMGSPVPGNTAQVKTQVSLADIKAAMKTPTSSDTIGGMVDGDVIGTPDGKIGVLKPSETAYTGYVAAYDIVTGTKFEAPANKKPYLVVSTIPAKEGAQELLKKAQTAAPGTVQVASGGGSAHVVGPPPKFNGVASGHAAGALVSKWTKAAGIDAAGSAALSSYVGSSTPMNSALRGDSMKPKSVAIAKQITAVDRAMDKVTFEEPVVIIRKTNNPEWLNATVGGESGVITDNGYFSTSLSATAISTGGVFGNSGDGAVEVHALVPKGGKGVDVMALGVGMGHEQEVVLPRGSYYEVLKKESKPGGVTVLYVEMMV